jgi:hypothetical protein
MGLNCSVVKVAWIVLSTWILQGMFFLLLSMCVVSYIPAVSNVRPVTWLAATRNVRRLFRHAVHAVLLCGTLYRQFVWLSGTSQILTNE